MSGLNANTSVAEPRRRLAEPAFSDREALRSPLATSALAHPVARDHATRVQSGIQGLRKRRLVFSERALRTRVLDPLFARVTARATGRSATASRPRPP